MSHNRRDFLKQLSVVTAFGIMHQIPGRKLWAVAPDDFIPEADEALLRKLALIAIDAARSAGAEFADVRVSATRGFGINTLVDRIGQLRPGQGRPSMNPPSLVFTTDYGIRALVDGAWGFAGGTQLTPEAIAEVARTTLSRARANRPRSTRRLELAPVPTVENGRWATPIEQDAFGVSIGEQADLALEALTATEGVRGVIFAQAAWSWSQTLHLFASSEGSLIVQRLAVAGPDCWVIGKSQDDHDRNNERPVGLRQGGYGYEAVKHSGLDLVAEMRETAKRAVANSKLPGPTQTSVEVGRYDLVLGAGAVANVFLNTLAPALNLERALGYHANRAGTSFAAPPAEMLDKYEIGSKLVTLRADRTRPHANGTVGWDDEGVSSGEHTLIEKGVIVDYLTSRQTAAELAAAYQARGEAVRSRGCTLGRGQDRPQVSTPNLTLEPGQEDVSVDDLVADTKRGFYVPSAFGSSDQQLLSGQFTGSGVREIRDGKLGRPMKDFAFQFLTPQFWKSVDAIGGPGSVVETILPAFNVRAVPARVRELNVLNTGITL